MARLKIVILAWLCATTAAMAEQISLFAAHTAAPLIVAPADRLIAIRQNAGILPVDPDPVATDRMSASLFSGRIGHGFFAPLPKHTEPNDVPGTGGSPAARLLNLIAAAEAGPMGYDAVQYRARVRPGKPPTRMTLGAIYAWIAATPGQPHAIGRYQFIPPTLKRLAKILGYGPETRFSPKVQDSLALILLEEAGYSGFLAGEVGRVKFMANLSRIWAGLPLPNGRSYYHGYAGNAASMTWARFDAGMAKIWPANG